MPSRFLWAVVLCVFVPGSLRATAEPGTKPSALPRSIVSLSPSVTEILYGVGAFERVVAVSSYCAYPPEVDRLPRVGGWLDTNVERIAALRPDLVILTDAQAPFFVDRFEALGLPVLVVGAQTLADVFGAIESIGRAVGKAEEADSLTRRTRAELEAIRERTRSLPHPRVLTVVDRLPGTLRDLYVAAEGSFLTELVEIAGGRPITPESALNYAEISTEAVVALDPDVILDMARAVSPPVAFLSAGSRWAEDPAAVWAELGAVRAVREHRVYGLYDDALIHPSQRVGRAARQLARTLHPEVFSGNETEH